MDIDFVIPWVDGDDPEWISEYNKYSKTIKKTDDARSIRYKDYGLLKYWFRSIEKNAPWVRKIHFITNGQKPSWLNIDHPKLNWVKHQDYIPKEYLPVFSANPIEINMHRIKDLAEHFVYFNDDMYLLKPVKPSFFFSKKGLPLDSAIMSCISYFGISHIIVNDMEIINREFSKKKVLHKYFYKWFSLKYGLENYRNIVLLPWSQFTGFLEPHLPQAFLKKTFFEVWGKYPVPLELTNSNRFRSIEDVNQYLFRNWQLCKGEFKQTNLRRRGRYFCMSQIESIRKHIKKTKYPMICINDDTEDYDMSKEVIAIMESLFYEKSQFEL